MMSQPLPEHALVVGKFFPPHLGHVHLVRSALKGARRVTVQVLYASSETIPGPTRAQWLRDCFPGDERLRVVHGLDDIAIDYESAEIWDAHEAIMRDLIAESDKFCPWPKVDAVFTSEPYGREMARRFRAKEACVDPDRATIPVSGTKVRADLAGNWHHLPSPVRAGLARRIIVVGAESTGTTTLSLDLHAALVTRGGAWENTRWVGEYGREYSEEMQRRQREAHGSALPSEFPWREADFVTIAREQNLRENQSAAEGSPILVCDTDSLATCLWHERYMGTWSDSVETISQERCPRALYLLTSDDGVPFEDDGLRDQPHLRPAMTSRFREILARGSTPFHELVGTREARLKQALMLVDGDFAHTFGVSNSQVPPFRLTFGSPCASYS